MGKKGSWFSAIKKDLCPGPKEKKDRAPRKSKKRWFRKHKSKDLLPLSTERTILAAPAPTLEETQLTEAENEHSKQAYSVALATAAAAEAAVAAANAAAEVVRLTAGPHFSSKSKEEVAAIKIQTAFRGYLARRALRALRGLARLKSLMQGQSVKRQATSTLRCMHTLAHVQSHIRARRIRMSEENQALQRQLQQKHDKELDNLRASMGEDWKDGIQSKEQIEAKELNRRQAALRRERALAYAFSHQQMWRNSSKSAHSTFMDPNNPRWGWSWLERWMASHPWESRTAIDKELNDHSSAKSTMSRATSALEISKPYNPLLLTDKKASPTALRTARPASRQSPSTPPSKPCSSSSGVRKIKHLAQKSGGSGTDDDSRSMFSVQSERNRRHSIAGSSVRDDESLASSPALPSYMASTESARARSRLPSPLGLEKRGTPEKGSFGSAKKKLSFSPSPSRAAAQRRQSGPAKVESSYVKDIGIHAEEKRSNCVSS